MSDIEAELHNGVAEAQKKVIVLNCSDVPLHHWSLNVKGLGIRMNVNGSAFSPVHLIRGDAAFFAAEQGIFVIDLHSQVVKNCLTDVTEVQWIDDGSPDDVVIAAENEVLVFDNLGTLRWRKSLPDSIQSTDVSGKHARITTMSGDSFELDLSDGSWSTQ